jgi:hypothetical protein
MGSSSQQDLLDKRLKDSKCAKTSAPQALSFTNVDLA